MGVPFKRLICASNLNNVLTDFLSNGIYDIRSRRLLQTSSPAIDILVSSNLERLLYSISDRDSEFVKSAMEGLMENKYFEVSEQVKIGIHCTECYSVTCLVKWGGRNFALIGYLVT